MNWREKRREELKRLGSSDPAMLAVRYDETALHSEVERSPPRKVSLAAMIEAILDAEAALSNTGAARLRRPQISDNVAPWPSQQEVVKR